MKELREKITAFLKNYWNIYGSILLSTFFSWITEWNASKIALINQFIGITISIMCLLTIIKFLIHPRAKKTPIEKLVTTQKCVKNMNTSIDPKEKIDNGIELISETIKGGKKGMKKIKNCFKWVWAYRQQLISLVPDFVYAVSLVYCFILDKFGNVYNLLRIPDTMLAHTIFKIVVALISVFFVYFSVRNKCKWVGLGSLTKAQEYLQNIQNSVASSKDLSPETKANIKNKLKIVKNALNVAKKSLKSAKEKLDKCVSEVKVFNELIELSMPYDNVEYSKALTAQKVAEQEYNNILKTVETYENQVEQYEKYLK